MKLPVSIIIPTFNEEKYLPKLLNSINNQTIQPEEIIISDAFSIDKTREIAKSFHCKVIQGGLPGAARNNGVKVATQPIILFLDADIILPSHFLEKCIVEMIDKNLDITSCFVVPISTLKIDRFLHEFVNRYFKFTQKFYPHIPGFCIFVKKKLHEAIGGFDESLILAEDHDYVQRAKKKGKFTYLKSYKIPVSVRRLSKDGRIKIALKYVAVELHMIFLGKIRRNFIKYKFGEYFK